MPAASETNESVASENCSTLDTLEKAACGAFSSGGFDPAGKGATFAAS
jgi:hypothetical protein